MGRRPSRTRPLQMVPTEYYNVNETPYKQALREQMDSAVVVHWTGIGVVPRDDHQRAGGRGEGRVRARHPDLGQLPGQRLRARPDPARGVQRPRARAGRPGRRRDLQPDEPGRGQQARALLVRGVRLEPGDVRRSWRPGIARSPSGPAATPRRSRRSRSSPTSPATTGSCTWRTRRCWPRRSLRSGRTWEGGDLAGAIAELEPYFEAIENAPAQIRAGVFDPAFADEADAWLDASFYWGQALREALRVLEAGAEGNSSDVATSQAQINHLVTQAEEIRDIRLPHSRPSPHRRRRRRCVHRRASPPGYPDRWAATGVEVGDHRGTVCRTSGCAARLGIDLSSTPEGARHDHCRTDDRDRPRRGDGGAGCRAGEGPAGRRPACSRVWRPCWWAMTPRRRRTSG